MVSVLCSLIERDLVHDHCGADEATPGRQWPVADSRIEQDVRQLSPAGMDWHCSRMTVVRCADADVAVGQKAVD